MKKIIVGITLTVLIVFITFYSTLFHQFVGMDDPGHLLENKNVLSMEWGNIIEIFKSKVNKLYIPLTVLSFAVEYHFFKFNPFFYHLDNLLLHLGVVVFVFWLAIRFGLSVTGAAAAALLFGIHPMHVESVVWVTERKDVLYSFFYMAALLSYSYYLFFADSRGMFRRKKQYWFLGLTTLFGALSILAKPMALSLPLILFLLDWFRGRKIGLEVFIEKIPLGGFIAWVTWMSYVEYMHAPGQSSVKGALFWIWSFVFYLRQFIFPSILVPIYPLSLPVSFSNPEYFLSVILFCFLIFALVRFRKNFWFIFSIAFYFLSIFFLLGVDVRIGVNTVADRFAYLPSLGICLWFGFLVDQLIAWAQVREGVRRGLFILLGGAFLMLSSMTINQSLIWRNDKSYWDYIIRTTPRNWLAFFARGKALRKQGDLSGAIAEYTKAVSINPNNAMVYNNRGVAYALLGKYDLADRDFAQAIAIDSKFASAYNNKGYLYFILGKRLRALENYMIAIQLSPRDPEIYLNRSRCYYELKRSNKALEDEETARLLGL